MCIKVMTVSKVGDRLKESLPLGRGEQKALAHRAGVTPETLNRILSGVIKEPGFETIAKIARVSGLDMNRLIAETGEPQIVESLMAEMISAGDRRRLQEFVSWIAARFGIVTDGQEFINSLHQQGSGAGAPATASRPDTEGALSDALMGVPPPGAETDRIDSDGGRKAEEAPRGVGENSKRNG